MSETDRAERPGDEAAIEAVILAAFGPTGEAALVRELRQARAMTQSLVALEGEDLVGHVALSPLTVQGALVPGVLGLAPLAVRPDRQRRGHGSRLVEAAIAGARTAGDRIILLLGDPAYYRRFGFRDAAAMGLTCPWEVPPGAFQALLLAPPWPRGAVRWHAAFHHVAG